MKSFEAGIVGFSTMYDRSDAFLRREIDQCFAEVVMQAREAEFPDLAVMVDRARRMQLGDSPFTQWHRPQ